MNRLLTLPTLTALLCLSMTTAQQPTTALLDIPWKASKATVMKQMKAYRFVLERTDDHPKCGIDLYYGGTLLGERVKIVQIINSTGQWVGAHVTFVKPSSQRGTYDDLVGSLSLKYDFEPFPSTSHRDMVKAEGPDKANGGHSNFAVFIGKLGSSVVMDYSSSLRQWEGECRYYNNGL